MEKFGEDEKTIEALRERDPVADLESPIETLLQKLKSGIDRGAYKLLIGDDASGRIPTLIFRESLKQIYKENGFAAPKAIFFAGSGQGPSKNRVSGEDAVAKSELISEYLEHVGAEELLKNDGEALLITDTISTGNSLLPLIGALKNMGVRFEIVAIGLEPDWKESPEKCFERITKALGQEPIYAGNKVPNVFGDKRSSGVIKEPSDVFSKRLPKEAPSPEEEWVGPAVESARKKAEELGTRLADDYLGRE